MSLFHLCPSYIQSAISTLHYSPLLSISLPLPPLLRCKLKLCNARCLHSQTQRQPKNTIPQPINERFLFVWNEQQQKVSVRYTDKRTDMRTGRLANILTKTLLLSAAASVAAANANDAFLRGTHISHAHQQPALPTTSLGARRKGERGGGMGNPHAVFSQHNFTTFMGEIMRDYERWRKRERWREWRREWETKRDGAGVKEREYSVRRAGSSFGSGSSWKFRHFLSSHASRVCNIHEYMLCVFFPAAAPTPKRLRHCNRPAPPTRPLLLVLSVWSYWPRSILWNLPSFACNVSLYWN